MLDATPARCENWDRSPDSRNSSLVTQPSPSEIHPVPKAQAAKASFHKLAQLSSGTEGHHVQVGQGIAWTRIPWFVELCTVQTSGQ